jgi:hypothetical protein
MKIQIQRTSKIVDTIDVELPLYRRLDGDYNARYFYCIREMDPRGTLQAIVVRLTNVGTGDLGERIDESAEIEFQNDFTHDRHDSDLFLGQGLWEAITAEEFGHALMQVQEMLNRTMRSTGG